ncbi:hypothetical protein WA026_013857 [Henosepilachna vigintioctopunctata]|uniref:Uncharacterized protein n=1 Tax=Henosepilachna vigintioctopunctata TaxID=420089 RepID=A0AAW1V142_9CUCU
MCSVEGLSCERLIKTSIGVKRRAAWHQLIEFNASRVYNMKICIADMKEDSRTSISYHPGYRCLAHPVCALIPKLVKSTSIFEGTSGLVIDGDIKALSAVGETQLCYRR